MEEKNDINKILEMLNESIKSGLYFEIRAEDSQTLLEYIETQNKQIGIEKTVNGMKQNDINTLMNALSRAENRIVALENKLTNSEINKLENRKMELENDITTKEMKLRKYSNAVKQIEVIIDCELIENYDD